MGRGLKYIFFFAIIYAVSKKRIFQFELFSFRHLMDEKTNRSTNDVVMYWPAEQAEILLCILCYHLVFPPMQLICCGLRVCEACARSKYYLLICGLTKSDV